MKGIVPEKPRTYESHAVWDVPTRWLHWLIALAVVALGFLGFLIYYRQLFYIEGAAAKLSLKKVHAVVGYALVACLLLRILWGFAGNRFARWAAVLPGSNSMRQLPADVRALAEGRPNQYLGRSPLSRLSVTLMFAVLLTSAVSGLVIAAIGLFFPPFGDTVRGYLAAVGVDPSTLRVGSDQGMDPVRLKRVLAIKDAFGNVHVWSAYTVVVLVIAHVAGVVSVEIRKGGGLVSAMFTGRKMLAVDPIDADEQRS